MPSPAIRRCGHYFLARPPIDISALAGSIL